MPTKRPKWYVVTAFAESFSGPGWANSPIIVIEQIEGANQMRTRYIQPEEQTSEMQTLYRVSAAIHAAMTRAVNRGK